MGADNTTNDRHPFEIDEEDTGPFGRSITDPPEMPPSTAPRPTTSGTRQLTPTSPSPKKTVAVCLDCETYYPDGDAEWDYCPHCGARVFEVAKA
jgi:hypothetical protein